MPEFAKLLFLLLSAVDGKTVNLLRFYELEIDFLLSRVKGRLLPEEAEKAAFARLAQEIGRPDLADRALLFHPETLFRWHRELIVKCRALIVETRQPAPGAKLQSESRLGGPAPSLVEGASPELGRGGQPRAWSRGPAQSLVEGLLNFYYWQRDLPDKQAA
jgi:hypothetical protein